MFEAWYEAVEECWGSMSCPLNSRMSEIQQAGEEMKTKAQWFLSSVSSEHQRAVNELNNECAMTRSVVKYLLPNQCCGCPNTSQSVQH